MSVKRSILITGVTSGIGKGLARKFLLEGFRVFGSVRTSEKAAVARSLFSDNFIPLVFDICHIDQVKEARKLVEEALAGEPLEAIINNAGMAEMGPLLHARPESFSFQLNTLVVGQLAVVQCFHDLLTVKGATPGVIYNMSSISGVGANPYFGCYAAGKHALEGLSKTLRVELARFGTKVVVVAPANVDTDIWPKQTVQLIEQYRDTDYYEVLLWLAEKFHRKDIAGAMTVGEFSEAFFKIYCMPAPAHRYTVYKGSWGPFPLSKLSGNRVRISKK